MSKKVVIGFSGGLDTSYCVKYFKDELGYEVHSIIVNTGGFSKQELKDIEKHAKALGVTSPYKRRRSKKLLRFYHQISHLWKCLKK